MEMLRTQHDVSEDLVVGHLDVTNSNTHTQDLLKLELDGGTNFVDLVVQIFRVRDGSWEFAS